MHPMMRLLAAFDPADLRIALPPVVAWRAARLFTDPPTGTAALMTPDGYDPGFTDALMDAVGWLGRRWFRWRGLDADRVPADGPALLVGNHNGGLMTFDAMFILRAVRDARGPERIVHGLGHDFVHLDSIIRKYTGRAGVLPASPESVAAAFKLGRLVLVFPGSDYDSFRPFAERDRVVLAGRTGFVRVALTHGVPIVPVVTVGAQETFVVLTRGERLASLLGLKARMRSNVFPIAVSFPWGLTSALVPYVPLPTRITTAFCRPLRWPDLKPRHADDDEVVRRCYAEVEASMQERMAELSRGRRPWIG